MDEHMEISLLELGGNIPNALNLLRGPATYLSLVTQSILSALEKVSNYEIFPSTINIGFVNISNLVSFGLALDYFQKQPGEKYVGILRFEQVEDVYKSDLVFTLYEFHAEQELIFPVFEKTLDNLQKIHSIMQSNQCNVFPSFPVNNLEFQETLNKQFSECKNFKLCEYPVGFEPNTAKFQVLKHLYKKLDYNVIGILSVDKFCNMWITEKATDTFYCDLFSFSQNFISKLHSNFPSMNKEVKNPIIVIDSADLYMFLKMNPRFENLLMQKIGPPLKLERQNACSEIQIGLMQCETHLLKTLTILQDLYSKSL